MLERDDIARALREAGGKIGKAARLLGASRRTLQNRMRYYGMARGKAGRPKRKLSYGRKRGAWLAGGAAAAAVVGGLVLMKGRGRGA